MSKERDDTPTRRQIRMDRAVYQTQGEWFAPLSMERKVGLPANTTLRYLASLVDEEVLEMRRDEGNHLFYRLTQGSINMLMIQGLALVGKTRRREEPA